MGRPRTGKQPHRSLRVPDHIWHRAQERAREEGRSLSEVMVAYLDRYGRGQPRRR